MTNKDHLLSVCKEFTIDCPKDTDIVVPEPYLPLIPEKWNGLLVLAQSQNLANPEADYVKWLVGLSPNERMLRLELDKPQFNFVGVGPWDDGHIPLAVKALAPTIELNKTAVGNAVPWSRPGSFKMTSEMLRKSTAFWSRLWKVWDPKPKAVLALGKEAQTVLANANLDVFHLRHPSTNYLSRVCGFFGKDDLAKRYELSGVLDADDLKPFKTGDEWSHTRIFFAAHAISLIGNDLKKALGHPIER